MFRQRNVAGTRERTHEHYWKGLLYCGECGRRLSLTLAKGKYLYFYCLGQKNALRRKTGCSQKYVMAIDAEKMVEDLYRRVQLPPEWVKRLEEELEAEIVERQSIAADLKVGLTERLSDLADERQKLLRAYYANAISLDLLKSEQDRITKAEESARAELEAAEADLKGWQEVLTLAIRLAGNCHDAYLKARPKVRRRFNEAVLEAVHIADGKAKAEFNELFDALFLSKSSNKALHVPGTGFEPARACAQSLLRRSPVPFGYPGVLIVRAERRGSVSSWARLPDRASRRRSAWKPRWSSSSSVSTSRRRHHTPGKRSLGCPSRDS